PRRPGPSLDRKPLRLDRPPPPPPLPPPLVCPPISLPVIYHRKGSFGPAGITVPRYVYELPRARPWAGRCATAVASRLLGVARPARPGLLRPAADLQWTARRSRPPRPPQCRSAVPLGHGGQPDHCLRAKLHPDDQGRLSSPAARTGAMPGRKDRRGMSNVRGTPGEFSVKSDLFQKWSPSNPRAGALSSAVAGGD